MIPVTFGLSVAPAISLAQNAFDRSAFGHQPTGRSGSFQRVPRRPIAAASANPVNSVSQADWNLQWRPSPQLSHGVVRQVSRNDQYQAPRAPTNRLQVAGSAPQFRSVEQTAWKSPESMSDPFDATPVAAPSFFDQPFGDRGLVNENGSSHNGPPSAPPIDPSTTPISATQKIANVLRSPSELGTDVGGEAEISRPSLAATSADRAEETPSREARRLKSSQPDDAPSVRMLPQPQSFQEPQEFLPRLYDNPPGPGAMTLGQMIKRVDPSIASERFAQTETDDRLPPPNNQRGRKSDFDKLRGDDSRTDGIGSEADEFANPFDNDRYSDEEDRDRLQREAADDGGRADRYGDEYEDEPIAASCEDFRKRIKQQTIEQVSLDISEPYRPDEIDQQRFERLKREFDEQQEVRQWRGIDGQLLGTGSLRDLAYEKAVIETYSGNLQEIPLNLIGEADLAYIHENWGLPRECLLEQVAFTPRSWACLTMTWKASNLCHTPLYFEDVQLERYGHTRGPIVEPFVQSAHFFANIAILPYKMGVHSPHECQYALGYYRPGSCAPWIKPAIPISARGALAQGATVTGLFWLIP